MKQVTEIEFRYAYAIAWHVSENVRNSCTHLADMDLEGKYLYLSNDKKSGYVLSIDGELTSVFSTVRGRGSAIITHAISKGAKKLDCFDGYLVDFYRSFGFVEYKRVPNWTEGEPSVIYMQLPNKLTYYRSK